MRRSRRVLAAVVLAAVGAVAALGLPGCGDPDPEGPGSESGQYAGMKGPLGGLVDFFPSDPVVSRLTAVIERDGIDGTVAVASVVNRSDRLVVIPSFTAHRLNGVSVLLARADRDPRFAAAEVPGAGTYVPAEGALTVYLVMPGTPRDVVQVGMRVGIGQEIMLTPQRADGAQPAPRKAP